MSNIFLPQAKAERFAELDENRHALKPEEMKEYLNLLQENSKIFAERDGKIDTLKKQAAELKASPLELFTPADFTVESALDLMVNLQAIHHFSAEQLGVTVTKGSKGKGKGKGAGSSAQRATRPSDANPILIKIPGTPRGVDYHKGRIYEQATASLKAPYQTIAKVLTEHGKDEKSLKPFFTPEGTEYFKTEEGKAELKALLHAVANPKDPAPANPFAKQEAAAA
ncbi:hypothetical protein [Ralstonia pseudosolanacearum]|uniref:Uncharacterized protein n=1 Tax=Ralstonia solanacearum TaxID=305 RepID=A0ABY6NFS1_RALSL|nr:hypothetical protein LH706_06875 [Ralstonia solanacearum]